MVKRAPNGGGFEVKKKLKEKIFSAVFVACWFGIYLLTASFEQFYITAFEYIIYSLITFIALGVSGALSGLLTKPDYNRRAK